MNKKVSIVIPFHWMDNWATHLMRCLISIESQSYTNYEIILMKVGSMPETSNRVIQAAKGDIIKVLYMDDFFATRDSLKDIVEAIGDKEWLVSGCLHLQGEEAGGFHSPSYSKDIHTGNNTIGSPSVLAMKKKAALLFDEKLSWMLDCDLYRRLYEKYGEPVILDTANVVIGIHAGQTSVIMSLEDKQAETSYVIKKYGK